jgi:proteasome lid subunit RPN8/RPN11
MIKYDETVLNKLTQLLGDQRSERVACLVGKKSGEDFVILDILPARNEDYRPTEEFYVSGQQMSAISKEAQRRGYSVLGVAHSHMPHHPSVPSQADIQCCRHPVNAVYHPTTSALTWFNSNGQIKREFLIILHPQGAPNPLPMLA